MIADVVAGLEGVVEVVLEEGFGVLGGGSGDDVDVLFGEEHLGALSHAASDDEVDVLFGEPAGEDAGFVGRWFEQLRLGDGFALRIDVDDGEVFAVAEVQGELAIGDGNSDTHGLGLLF